LPTPRSEIRNEKIERDRATAKCATRNGDAWKIALDQKKD
jgi:hypothetical protein